MPYRIEFRPAAVRGLRRIARPDKIRILTAMAALAQAPRPPGSVKLEGPERFHRIRVGGYRVICLIADQLLLICVVRVGQRKDVYPGM